MICLATESNFIRKNKKKLESYISENSRGTSHGNPRVSRFNTSGNLEPKHLSLLTVITTNQQLIDKWREHPKGEGNELTNKRYSRTEAEFLRRDKGMRCLEALATWSATTTNCKKNNLNIYSLKGFTFLKN